MFISVAYKYLYCSRLMRFSEAREPLPELLSITSAEKHCDRNNLLWVDYVHTTNITLLNGSISKCCQPAILQMWGGYLLMTVLPKILKVVLICSGYIKENKNKTAEAFLAIAQRWGAPSEIVIKGSSPFLFKEIFPKFLS